MGWFGADKNCPNCSSKDVGTLWKCKTCGGVFCPECAKGFFDKSCPHCGSNEYPNKI